MTATRPGARASASVRQTRGKPLWIRVARIVALALIIGVGISQLIFSVQDWHLRDMDAYWDAGLRLRGGDPLFPPGAGVEGSDIYRYSPWFAWLWVPVTFLPRIAANVLWSALLLGASAAAIRPLIRRRAWAAVALFVPILVGISAIGNAHPLLIAGLVLGIERRSGPIWIAIASSLKIVPIVLVLTYVGRREWTRAVATLVATAVLLSPFLLYDLSGYVTDAGGAALLLRNPALYVGLVLIAALGALWLARGRYAWLASALTLVLALPRFFVYDLTYLMVGIPEGAGAARGDKFPIRDNESGRYP